MCFPDLCPNLRFLITCTSGCHCSLLTQLDTLGKAPAMTAQESPTVKMELNKSTGNRSRGINRAWSRWHSPQKVCVTNRSCLAKDGEKSQIPGMQELVKGTSADHPVPSRDHPQQVAQDHIQPGFENFCSLRVHNLWVACSDTSSSLP